MDGQIFLFSGKICQTIYWRPRLGNPGSATGAVLRTWCLHLCNGGKHQENVITSQYRRKPRKEDQWLKSAPFCML